MNQGDTMRSRASSLNSSVEGLSLSSRASSVSSLRGPPPQLESSTPDVQVYRVVLVGGPEVGKSSLCSQFLSSEHVNTYARVEDSVTVEKEVVVAVDGEEGRLVFIDHQHGAASLESLLVTYQPHAFLVVLAVDDLTSLETAERLLAGLRSAGGLEDRAVILVANKTDLVRNREVKTSMGKELALKYRVKYIETSPGINHNIDELLVGVFTQINLRRNGKQKASATKKVGQFLDHLLHRQGSLAKSCSNLAAL